MKFLKFIFVFVVISSMIFSVEYSKTVNLPNADGQTPLSIAVEEKNIEKIKSLINKKMDPNSKLNEFGETLLMWACRNSQKELVEFLLSKGANLDIKDSDGETVLAYSESKPEILKLLVAGGLNPNSKDSDGTPILIKYINIGDTDLVRLLLEKGANIKYNPEEGYYNPVEIAIYSGNKDIIKMLIEAGVDINQEIYFETEYDGYSKPFIQWAVDEKYNDIVKLLLEKGATFENDEFSIVYGLLKNKDFDNFKLMIEKGLKLNESREETEKLPVLNWAIKNNYDDIALLAIDKGADFNFGVVGLKPINIMLENKKMELIKAVVEKGFDINEYLNKENNLTLLSWAVINKNIDLANFLVEKKVDVNRLMTSGMTALMLASQNNDAEMVKILLKGGADVKIKNSSGKTARDLATSDTVKELLNPNKKIILASVIGVLVFVILLVVLLRGKKNSKYKLLNAIKAAKYDKAISLINKGSNLELKDENGLTPLFYSIKENHVELVKALINKGVNINSLDTNGNTPLNFAIENGKEAIANHLIDFGAEANIKNNVGHDTIALSILNNYNELTEKLIKKGVSIYNRYLNGKTLLHLACENDNMNAVKYLLNKKFDVNVNDNLGKTPLNYTINDEIKTMLNSSENN